VGGLTRERKKETDILTVDAKYERFNIYSDGPLNPLNFDSVSDLDKN